MACGGCANRRMRTMLKGAGDDVMGGYKYLTDRQIKARLEIYKKKNCKECDNRYDCDYELYVKCKKS